MKSTTVNQTKHNNALSQTQQVTASMLTKSQVIKTATQLKLGFESESQPWDLHLKSPLMKVTNKSVNRTVQETESNSRYPTYLDDVFGADSQLAECGIRPARQHRQWRWWWWCVIIIRQSQTLNVDTPCLVRHHVVATRWHDSVPRHAHVISANVSHVHVRHARRCHVTKQLLYLLTLTRLETRRQS